VEGDCGNSSDGDESGDSEDEAGGLKNAYSVGDLVGELSCSDDDIMEDEKGRDSTLRHPDDPASTVPVNSNCDVISEQPAGLQANTALDGESTTCQAEPDAGDAVAITDIYSRVYDEVLTENIYQGPAENDGGSVASK